MVINLENINDLIEMNYNTTAEFDLVITLTSFAFCVLMSFILKSIYYHKSYSLTGKLHIGNILPVLSMVVFVVILIVKSSLALSLGLVGALSIVRFRTPVKEPEELVFLFLSIAIGLGYGAGQIVITTLILLLIFIVIMLRSSGKLKNTLNEYTLVLNWDDESYGIDDIIHEISLQTTYIKLARYEKGENNTAVFTVQVKDSFTLLTNSLSQNYSNLDITFYEAKSNW